jgi:hypothetical protein
MHLELMLFQSHRRFWNIILSWDYDGTCLVEMAVPSMYLRELLSEFSSCISRFKIVTSLTSTLYFGGTSNVEGEFQSWCKELWNHKPFFQFLSYYSPYKINFILCFDALKCHILKMESSKFQDDINVW